MRSGILLNSVLFLIMLSQQVLPKVIAKASPDRMNMIGLILGIIIFQEEIFSLKTIIMPFARFNVPGPGKQKLVQALV